MRWNEVSDGLVEDIKVRMRDRYRLVEDRATSAAAHTS